MQSSAEKDNSSLQNGVTKRARNLGWFAGVVITWLVFDQISKSIVNSHVPGDLISGPYLGLFDFTLVHNTGAAWGAFDGATVALAVFSIAVCAFIIVYLFVLAPNSSLISTIGLSLVFAGGIGNMIDRLSLGYVIDFVRTTFIDFPVFNIADIGVTCGFAVFFIGYLIEWRNEKNAESSNGEAESRKG